jgi:hypothetical protein
MSVGSSPGRFRPPSLQKKQTSGEREEEGDRNRKTRGDEEEETKGRAHVSSLVARAVDLKFLSSPRERSRSGVVWRQQTEFVWPWPDTRSTCPDSTPQ